jgi:hypothetical protein
MTRQAKQTKKYRYFCAGERKCVQSVKKLKEILIFSTICAILKVSIDYHRRPYGEKEASKMDEIPSPRGQSPFGWPGWRLLPLEVRNPY